MGQLVNHEELRIIRRRLHDRARRAYIYRSLSMQEFEDEVRDQHPGWIEAIGQTAFDHLMQMVWESGGQW